MLPTIDRLFEAHLNVANLDASIGFYRDLLGLEVAHLEPARKVAFVWIGSPGRTMLGLWETDSGVQQTMHIAFAVRVEDVVEAPPRLRSAGIAALDFWGEPTDEPVVLAWMPAASVYFRDPDSHLLEYIAMLDDLPHSNEGVLTWREWVDRRSA